MTIEFTDWPQDRAQRYRDAGYWIDQPLTEILHSRCQAQPQALAIICGERRFTYGELDTLSSILASRLAEQGLGQGDTALVQLPNVAEFYIVLFALLKAGIVPLNALFSHRRLELTAYAKQIVPKLLIASREHEVFRDDAYVQAFAEVGAAPAVTLLLGESDPAASLAHWIETPGSQPVAYAPTAADQVALFQLSGGSTGIPKLIPRTHNDYHYNARACADVCALNAHTRFLCAVPAAHNFLLSSPGALGVFHAGGCVVMAASPEPLSCFALVEQHEVNTVALVPSAVALWLQAAPAHRDKLQSLAYLQVGGAVFADSLARQVPGVLGCQLQQVFGMAEGLINYTRLDDSDEQIFTTQGRPVSPDDEIKIVDEQGVPVAPGEPGMLATRGPYTFCGYYKAPEQNASAFDAEGFYYSGDLVVLTPSGDLRVVGRIKDQINRGGEKVASEEIENLLVLHPEVTHAGLVAMPDEALGEKSCAFVVSRNPSLKAPALRRHLMELGIAEYKLPDRIRLIEAMPLTAVGKIDKKQLRHLVSVENTRTWLQTRLRQLIEDSEELDPEENLIFYGLDSLQVMKLAAELKARGIEVSFEELASTPTLASWWALVEARQKAA
ncbi:(2,3-dihydroxybenzoyl)adenylate synthase [Pseudomonas entomophila]|uniref:Pseudomonine synthase PmsE n=2 Tax=Pseudomonas entomophila TaxID=312306 RepID=PMSE_PSEE4|nr:(2,3-dihydroxybenzoyl)adenylate synthase [Pseudomonas entomophila]Q1IAK8.1 RecName: Full=Pseudomonine synthase PmsE; AltName: Full=Nonribosomal peptide synthase PmsE; AltName: Full=Salicylate--[aryl-carrier protein] ligase [Pseudomonas entomophila L48]WMW03921.1 (2,3-dihydroxybenzoyl)adenylate synthase [Pseudomonas entomophila]CAK15309.1 2,3-dihydroxybenzoate-AMP ligase [Pseudomonas entomophila L48]